MQRAGFCVVVLLGASLGAEAQTGNFAAPLNNQAQPATEEYQFNCPLDETTGWFPDRDYCDGYWECFRGNATFKECPDGLAFDPTKWSQAQRLDPCDYVDDVNCTGRELLFPPSGTGPCERKNGVYAVGREKGVCDKYVICKQDIPTYRDCPPGLHFSEVSKVCVWPDKADTETCTAIQSLQTTGEENETAFTCDSTKEFFLPTGQKIAHPKFPDLGDCRKFYLCLSGVTPRAGSCDYGTVFNDNTTQCDDPLNVLGCEDYYTYEENVTDPSTIV